MRIIPWIIVIILSIQSIFAQTTISEWRKASMTWQTAYMEASRLAHSYRDDLRDCQLKK